MFLTLIPLKYSPLNFPLRQNFMFVPHLLCDSPSFTNSHLIFYCVFSTKSHLSHSHTNILSHQNSVKENTPVEYCERNNSPKLKKTFPAFQFTRWKMELCQWLLCWQFQSLTLCTTMYMLTSWFVCLPHWIKIHLMEFENNQFI